MFLEVRNLEYKVGTNTILSKKNITLKKGDHLMISGPSGSGKTTLINLLTGLLRPSSGSICFEENDFSKLNDQEIDEIRFRYFGFIFQKLHLIKHLTVEQNILLGLSENQSINCETLLNDVGLKIKKKLLARDLSFGEAQRVAVARGIINKPKIIFADEPTSSLDDKNTSKILELIFDQAKKNNSSIILSSHDQRVKKFFKNILEIKL